MIIAISDKCLQYGYSIISFSISKSQPAAPIFVRFCAIAKFYSKFLAKFHPMMMSSHGDPLRITLRILGEATCHPVHSFLKEPAIQNFGILAVVSMKNLLNK